MPHELFLGKKKYTLVFFFFRFAEKTKNTILRFEWMNGPWTFSVKKKNTGGFFFFPKKSSWGIHSGSGGFFFIFFESGVCVFFFTFLCVFFVFFFSCKSSHAIHSFDLEAVFFFSSLEKKIQLFHSFNRLCLKMWKKWTFTGIKKIRYLCPILDHNSAFGHVRKGWHWTPKGHCGCLVENLFQNYTLYERTFRTKKRKVTYLL